MKHKKIKSLSVNFALMVLFIILFLSLLEVSLHLVYGKKLQFETDDELYWKLKPSQDGYPRASLPKAHINSKGFRGGEFKITKCSVMIIGDSYAFGWGIKDTETFSHLLNLKSEKTQFLNAANPGWGPFQFNAIFKRLYPEYDPDLVIIWLIEKDLLRAPFNNSREEKRFLMTSKIRNTYGFLTFIPFLKNAINDAFGTELGMPENIEYFDEDKPLKELWDFQSGYIAEIADILNEDNKELILILYPSIGNAAKTQEFYSLDFGVLGSNVRIINDLDADFEDVPEEELAIAGGGTHPNALAHEIVAERVYEELQKIPSFNKKECTV